MMKGVKIFIDESGQLGKQDRYIIFCCVALDDVNRKKWKKLSKFCIIKFNKNRLKRLDEIKAHHLTYKEKKYLIKEISNKIKYKLFVGIIDKRHQKFIDKFCKIESPSKEISVNYILGKIFCEKILKKIEQSEYVISMDFRNIAIKNSKSLEDYINTELIEELNVNVKINYTDSKNCKGIQLSDLFANIIFTKNNFNSSIGLYKKIEGDIDAILEYP